MNQRVIALACDHAGFAAKEIVRAVIEAQGCTVLDCGTHSLDSVDYPDYADALAAALAKGEATQGILLCGSGNGIAIAANRHAHIRAAVCHNGLSAKYARLHNDANVLAMGTRFLGSAVMEECVEAFLNTAFEGGRHQRRVEKLTRLGEAA